MARARRRMAALKVAGALGERLAKRAPRRKSDPVLRAMETAPYDDELVLTEEEGRSLDVAEQGEFFSLDVIRADLARRRKT